MNTFPSHAEPVAVGDAPPDRPVKAIAKVLDDDALLDEHLLKLTRWMADYYLCGWGQVLQAVLPAGGREQGGVRKAVVIEPGSEEGVPERLPNGLRELGEGAAGEGAAKPQAAANAPIELNADQLRAWAPVEQAVRGG